MPPQTPTIVNSTCYSEDGTTSEDIPCGFSSINTCCGSGWDCLDNGLCRQHGTTSFAQGSCTDPNYESCLSFCDKTQFSGQTEVSRCGTNSWCCAGEEGRLAGGSNCCNTNGTTSLEPFPFSTIVASLVGSTSVLIHTSSISATSSGASTSLSGEKTGPATTSKVVSASSKASSSVKQAVPTAQSTTLQRAPSTTPSPITTPQGNTLSTGAKIGIGVAVPIGVIVLAALAFFIYKSVKQGRHLSDLQRKNKNNMEDRSQDLSLGPTQEPGVYAEVGGDGRHEMSDVTDMRHELSGKSRHELPGRVIHELGPT